MEKNLYLFFMCLCISVFAIAQSRQIPSFNSTIHDFGTFSEDDDSPGYTFYFTNNGTSPIAITRVVSTCGCTAADYSRTPILPGKQGQIKVTYNPKGRPGTFNRSVIVNFSGSAQATTLRIKGTATPGIPRKYSGYNYVMGGLQLRNNTVRIRPLPGLKQAETSIMVINSSDQPLSIQLESATAALTGKASPQVLRPDDKGELIITYHSGFKLKDVEKVHIILNGEKNEKNFIKVLLNKQ